MKLSFLLLFAFFLSLHFVSAQQATIPLEVEASYDQNNSLANRFVFRLKEQIRESNGYRLTVDQTENRWVLSLVLLDRSCTDDKNVSCVYSLSLTMKLADQLPYFITQQVGFFGSTILDETVEGMLADVDTTITEILQAVQDE